MREQVVQAEQNHRSSLATFDRRAPGPGEGTPDHRNVRLALDFAEALDAYFSAQDRRTEASRRFQQLGTAVFDVEREVRSVATAEQAVRLTHRAFLLMID